MILLDNRYSIVMATHENMIAAFEITYVSAMGAML